MTLTISQQLQDYFQGHWSIFRIIFDKYNLSNEDLFFTQTPYLLKGEAEYRAIQTENIIDRQFLSLYYEKMNHAHTKMTGEQAYYYRFNDEGICIDFADVYQIKAFITENRKLIDNPSERNFCFLPIDDINSLRSVRADNHLCSKDTYSVTMHKICPQHISTIIESSKFLTTNIEDFFLQSNISSLENLFNHPNFIVFEIDVEGPKKFYTTFSLMLKM